MIPTTVRDVFRAAGLSPHGPVSWKERVPESAPGVYIISLTGSPDTAASDLEFDKLGLPGYSMEQSRWVPNQPVIYIGRTKRSLRQRLNEFYKHRYGERRPHRGGQIVTLLTCPIWVFWAPTNECESAEDVMIKAL